MKKLFVLAGAALVSFSLNAQRLDLGANFMMGMPMGNYEFGDGQDQILIPPGTGMAGGIEGNYWFSDAFSAGLEVGFLSFAEKEIEVDGDKLNSSQQIIPIIAKAEYHFLENSIRPFVGIGFGYGITSREINDSEGYKLNWNQNGFILSPRIGLLYQATDLIAVNLSIQYNNMLNSVNGDIELTEEDYFGTETFTQYMRGDATNYLGINIGVLFNLFD